MTVAVSYAGGTIVLSSTIHPVLANGATALLEPHICPICDAAHVQQQLPARQRNLQQVVSQLHFLAAVQVRVEHKVRARQHDVVVCRATAVTAKYCQERGERVFNGKMEEGHR